MAQLLEKIIGTNQKQYLDFTSMKIQRGLKMRKLTPLHDDIYKNMEYPKKSRNHLKAFTFQNHPLFLKPSYNDGNKYSQKHIRFCATCSTAQGCLTTLFLIHRDHYLSVNFLFLRFCGPFLVSILWIRDSKIFTSQTAGLGV